MSMIYQLPRIQIRGSIANITMKNLEQDQKLFCERMVDFIYNHPRLKQHKRMFVSKLSRTIKCDFSNTDSTDQDYRICLWKAVVTLFYHRKYDFYCKCCNSVDYVGKNGKTNKIDRLFDTCPACGATHDPEIVGKSPIGYNVGERYYTDPQSIIDDDKQLARYFGEWINNAITQQLFENNPTSIRREVLVTATYVEFVRSKIIDVLKRNKIAITTTDDFIKFPVMFYSPNFIQDVVNIVPGSLQNGVKIEITENGIRLLELSNCKTIRFKKPVHELIKLDSQSDDSENRTVIYDKQVTDDHKINTIDSHDFFDMKFDKTSIAICQILRQQGQAYNRYLLLYGDKITWTNISKMYGLSSKQMKRRRANIKKILVSTSHRF